MVNNMTRVFGGRPTLGFMTTGSTNVKRKLSEDCCEMARKNHLYKLVRYVNNEIENINTLTEAVFFFMTHDVRLNCYCFSHSICPGR